MEKILKGNLEEESLKAIDKNLQFLKEVELDKNILQYLKIDDNEFFKNSVQLLEKRFNDIMD